MPFNILRAFILTAIVVSGVEPAMAGTPEFPNVPDIPVPAGQDYGGYFKTHQPVRIVFGVSDPGGALKESLTNAAYTIKFLAPRKIKYQIQIVLYGRAVLVASEFSDIYAGYGPLMKALSDQGVEFRVCHNSMVSIGVADDDLYPYMKIIPAGILQITKKQMQGYAYISNH
jgi:intracellular sulfur oxidation DsrE/DsrF family protein